MKTLILFLAFTTSIGIYNACRPKAEKVDAEKARLETAEHEFHTDLEQFSKSWEKRFRQHKSMIELIRANSKELKGEEKVLQDKVIKELEKKNQVLYQKLKKYNYRGIKDWTLLKKEFSTEADLLDQTLRDVNKQIISP